MAENFLLIFFFEDSKGIPFVKITAGVETKYLAAAPPKVTIVGVYPRLGGGKSTPVGGFFALGAIFL